MPRLDSPCRINLHSRRHRLVDIDNLSAKAVIDGLVLAGILEDDSASYVKEVSQTQEKISPRILETTTVTITEV